MFVPENTENFKEDVTLRDRKSHEQYELTDDGAVICEKTASLIGVKAGDEIAQEKDNRKYKIKITAVTENYKEHYVFMKTKKNKKKKKHHPAMKKHSGRNRSIQVQYIL